MGAGRAVSAARICRALPRDPGLMLNAVFRLLHTGASWRDLPERFGPWETVFNTFSRWLAGVFERILEALQIRFDREGSRSLAALEHVSKNSPSTSTRWIPSL